MQHQIQQQTPWPHILSLVASILIGLDIFVFFYLFSFRVIGIIPAIFISSCGFVLNTYLYYIDGPENLMDFWASKDKSLWSKIFDWISLLGALLIFVFTYYVYAEMILLYPFLEFWCTPFLITIMAFSDSLGTLTMNKSGFLHLLRDYPFTEVKGDILQTMINAFKSWFGYCVEFCKKVALYDDQSSFNLFSIARLIQDIVFPCVIGFIVTFAFTKTYLLGALAVVQGSILSFILSPIIWVCAIAFFIGELYFVCEQNIQLMRSMRLDGTKSYWDWGNFVINLIIAANAIANGLIALEGSMLFLMGWGAVRFISTCLQNYYVLKNKCNQYPGFKAINNNQAALIFKHTGIIFLSLIAIYSVQLQFAAMGLPGVGFIPVFVVLASILGFLCLATIGCECLTPSFFRASAEKPLASINFGGGTLRPQPKVTGPNAKTSSNKSVNETSLMP